MIPLRLSFAHLRRAPLRAALTIASVLVTIFLFCILRTVTTSLDAAVKGASSNRIITSSSVSLFVQLPISMWKKIEAVPGVKEVTHWTWFGGVYKDETEFFARFGIDVPSLRRTYGDKAPEGLHDLIAAPEDWDEFLENRRACFVGKTLAERYGWKKGSRFPMIGNIFPGDYEFEVAGVYESGSPSIDTATMFFNWDYMNETSGRPNRVSTFAIVLDDPSASAEVAARIDDLFSNSSTRTRTLTERAFQAQFIQMWGNLPLMIAGISIAVFFACAMITVNTMLLLARERVRETGILKALGFSDATLMGLSLLEALVLCVLGALLGVMLATGIATGMTKSIEGFIPGFRVTGSTVREAIGYGALLGLVSGLVPALWVRRLRVLEALRKVG